MDNVSNEVLVIYSQFCLAAKAKDKNLAEALLQSLLECSFTEEEEAIAIGCAVYMDEFFGGSNGTIGN